MNNEPLEREPIDRMRARLEGPGGATAGDDRKMNNEPLEREPIDRVRARLEALLKANAAPRCGARSKRTGKPCRGAAMPNGRCKLHGGKSTGPRTPEGLERSRRANWKHGHFSREAKAERSRVRAAILALRYLRMLTNQGWSMDFLNDLGPRAPVGKSSQARHR
jgi:hypothetical protein